MAATTKSNNVVMDDQRKKVVRDLLLGNLKPSRLSKLSPELIIMIMESLFDNVMVFPDYPDIIKALDAKSEATAFHYTVETFIRHAKRARLNHGSVNQFPKLLEPEHHVDGEFKVNSMDKFGTKIQLQFMCESFGLRFYDLYITDLCLDFSKLNKTKLAEFKDALTSDKNFGLKPYFVHLASRLKRLAVIRGQFTFGTTKFQIACILQFLRHSKQLTAFRIIDTPSNDKVAYMNDYDDSMCALVRGISSIFDLNSRRTEGVYYETSVDDSGISQSLRSYKLPAEDPPIFRQVTFRWIATEGLKADVSKIDQLEPLFNERRYEKQKYHGHTEDTFARYCRPSIKRVFCYGESLCGGVYFNICHGCGPNEIILP
ncbi:uncharacterized protein Bfra_008551 [Botrytis fragariae]|uniref:Uncharacterized protein n=1 Tax=Botrytis fragariae TaxID=1964551 RepID=A0A8H6EIM5_9HELO|nr:uncharacterized protein Bfra_008551 [Botrytis fragariae]KAF5873270.1 hypothetical protein Bfra_008551 [Botrytis fragariae]